MNVLGPALEIFLRVATWFGVVLVFINGSQYINNTDRMVAGSILMAGSLITAALLLLPGKSKAE